MLVGITLTFFWFIIWHIILQELQSVCATNMTDNDSSDSHENMCVDGEIESQAREIPPVPPIDQNAQEVSSEPKDKKRKGKA